MKGKNSKILAIGGTIGSVVTLPIVSTVLQDENNSNILTNVEEKNNNQKTLEENKEVHIKFKTNILFSGWISDLSTSDSSIKDYMNNISKIINNDKSLVIDNFEELSDDIQNDLDIEVNIDKWINDDLTGGAILSADWLGASEPEIIKWNGWNQESESNIYLNKDKTLKPFLEEKLSSILEKTNFENKYDKLQISKNVRSEYDSKSKSIYIPIEGLYGENGLTKMLLEIPIEIITVEIPINVSTNYTGDKVVESNFIFSFVDDDKIDLIDDIEEEDNITQLPEFKNQINLSGKFMDFFGGNGSAENISRNLSNILNFNKEIALENSYEVSKDILSNLVISVRVDGWQIDTLFSGTIGLDEWINEEFFIRLKWNGIDKEKNLKIELNSDLSFKEKLEKNLLQILKNADFNEEVKSAQIPDNVKLKYESETNEIFVPILVNEKDKIVLDIESKNISANIQLNLSENYESNMEVESTINVKII